MQQVAMFLFMQYWLCCKRRLMRPLCIWQGAQEACWSRTRSLPHWRNSLPNCWLEQLPRLQHLLQQASRFRWYCRRIRVLGHYLLPRVVRWLRFYWRRQRLHDHPSFGWCRLLGRTMRCLLVRTRLRRFSHLCQMLENPYEHASAWQGHLRPTHSLDYRFLSLHLIF